MGSTAIVTCADTSTWQRQPTSCGAAPASSMLMLFDREWANIRVRTGGRSRPRTSSPPMRWWQRQHNTFIRRNREHGEWARTLILGNADRHHTDDVRLGVPLGVSAGVFDRSVELAHSGIRVARTGPSRHHLVLDVSGCCTRRVRPRQRSERCGAAQPARSLHRDDGPGRACPGAGADRHRSRPTRRRRRGSRLVHRARRGSRRPLAARDGEPLPAFSAWLRTHPIRRPHWRRSGAPSTLPERPATSTSKAEASSGR